MPVERREDYIVIDKKIDVMIEMLQKHMTDEEAEIVAIKNMVEDYFKGLDAHVHKYHHEHVAKEIEEDKEKESLWKDIKKGAIEKISWLVVGGTIMYIAHVIWEDIQHDLKQPSPVKPAVMRVL